jgi:glycosyltransferase involved in cell wall biosynthesis
VEEIMAGLDLLVHASLRPPGYADTEGFPLVALEAMLAGVPVVGYGNGGLPELVGTTGCVVPPGDRHALADAVVELLANDELRADLGARAQARVRSLFLLPASIDALEACLRAAAA